MIAVSPAARRTLLLLMLAAAASTGCASLRSGPTNSGPTNSDPSSSGPSNRGLDKQSPPLSTAAQVTVELHAKYKKPQRVVLPLDAEMTVDEALAKSGAKKRFRGMRLQVYRKNSEGQQIKLPVTYNRANRSVEPSYDYAVFPGDRIVVLDDPVNTLEEIMESMSNPGIIMQAVSKQ